MLREHKVYDIPVKYTKKPIGKFYVDCLGPKYLNTCQLCKREIVANYKKIYK